MESPSWYIFILLIALALLVSHLLGRIGRMEGAHRIRRWLPLSYALVWIGLVAAMAWTLASYGLDLKLLLLLFFVAIAALASLGWLRSIAAGIVLVWEGRIQVGQVIRVGDVQGQIVSMGMRSIRVRDADGVIHEIPHHAVVSNPFATYSPQGEVVCEIPYTMPRRPTLERDLETAREIAILTPLASPRHNPEVFLIDEDLQEGTLHIQIRGYAFSPTYRDHYRSDVIARLNQAFRGAEIGEIAEIAQ